MRLSISKSKNNEFLYIIKDFYFDKKRTSKVFKKLGKIEDLCKEKNMSCEEVISWAKSDAISLTEKEKNEKTDTLIPFSPDKIIERDLERKFNCGYLFLQDIYYRLKLDTICRNFKKNMHLSLICMKEIRMNS